MPRTPPTAADEQEQRPTKGRQRQDRRLRDRRHHQILGPASEPRRRLRIDSEDADGVDESDDTSAGIRAAAAQHRSPTGSRRVPDGERKHRLRARDRRQIDRIYDKKARTHRHAGEGRLEGESVGLHRVVGGDAGSRVRIQVDTGRNGGGVEPPHLDAESASVVVAVCVSVHRN